MEIHGVHYDMIEIPGVILAVQVTSFIIYVLVISLGIIWMRQNRKIKYMELPVIVLTVNLIIFYVASWLNNGGYLKLDNAVIVFTSWSAILRLQTALTFLGLEILRADLGKIKEYVVYFLKIPFEIYSALRGKR